MHLCFLTGTYYHYYSEVKGEGRVPMMGRAKNILGPYEHRQIGHVNHDQDMEPTQRSMRTSSNGVTTRIELSGMADGQRAGLCHLGAASQAAIGVIQRQGKRSVFFSTGSKLTPSGEFNGAAIWLRTSWGLDGMADFAFSADGKSFQPIGEKLGLTWAAYRGSRIGLFSYNLDQDAGHADFDGFHYNYSGQAAQNKVNRRTP